MKQQPICETYPDGTKVWLLNGKRHREDGPAVEEPNGTKQWYLNGERHREDGPAIEWPNGTKRWRLNGKQYTEQGYWQELYRRGKITEDQLVLELI